MAHNFKNIFFIFLQLGATTFGGPVAALNVFYNVFVQKKKWIDEKTYSDFVAISQCLPGPASSKVALMIGLKEKGILGGSIAMAAFALPSAILLTILAYIIDYVKISDHAPWFAGLKIAILAIVAQALFSMSKRFCTNRIRTTVMVISAGLMLLLQSFSAQIVVILIGALCGPIILSKQKYNQHNLDFNNQYNFKFKHSLYSLIIFAILLAMPILVKTNNIYFNVFEKFYSIGSFVFGGGHVVLPMLKVQFVDQGLIDKDLFLAGYGITQAMPGPLFGFSAFVATSMNLSSVSWIAGLLSVFCIYLPSYLLVIFFMPIWVRWQNNYYLQSILQGISVAVVGLLLAVFYDPVWIDAINSSKDFVIALFAFILLEFWGLSQVVIVILCALIKTAFFYLF